jgi:hypothetical protein
VYTTHEIAWLDYPFALFQLALAKQTLDDFLAFRTIFSGTPEQLADRTPFMRAGLSSKMYGEQKGIIPTGH